MKLLAFLIPLLLFAACAGPSSSVEPPSETVAPAEPKLPKKEVETAPKPTKPTVQKEAPKKREAIVAKPNKSLPESEPVLPPPAKHELRYQQLSREGVSFSIVSFDTRDHFLAVADQEPGKEWQSASQAAASIDGIAGINAGFFNTDGSPLGLVKARGRRAGHWNSQSSLASGVYQFSKNSSSLQRNKTADRSSPELVQTGPFLVENGTLVSGLSQKNPAQRSLVLWDGKYHMAIAMTSTCTLKKLSTAVKALPSNLPHDTALNLDGGRSCDLFVNKEISGGPVQKSHWLKNNVRNYLVLVKK